MKMPARPGLLALTALALTAAQATAQTIQIAPMAGYPTGGGLAAAFDGKRYSLASTTTYGGAVDLRISPSWRLELAYSRNPTQLRGPIKPDWDVTVEHWFVGFQEERGAADQRRYRWFGTLLLGATRLVPNFEADPEVRFAGGFAIGVKGFLSKNVGFRIEGRGIMTLTEAGDDVLCGGGTCYFEFDSSTFWQWEAHGGLLFAF